jgi:N-methylhydantoinase B
VDTVLGAFARGFPTASGREQRHVDEQPADRRARSVPRPPFACSRRSVAGTAAGPHGDGESAMQAHMTNTQHAGRIIGACVSFTRQRLRVRGVAPAVAGCTPEDGIERTIELLAPARVTVIAERRVLAPYGLAGGGPGALGATRVSVPSRGKGLRSRGKLMPGKFTIDALEHTVITVASPGGGGWGRARTREPRSARRVRST